MDKQVINDHASKTDRIILQLFGFETKWVRFNGKWVDLATLNTPKPEVQQTSEIEIHEEEETRKWWQFWKK